MHPANPPTIPAPTPPQETLEASLLAALARKELFSKLSTFAFSPPSTLFVHLYKKETFLWDPIFPQPCQPCLRLHLFLLLFEARSSLQSSSLKMYACPRTPPPNSPWPRNPQPPGPSADEDVDLRHASLQHVLGCGFAMLLLEMPPDGWLVGEAHVTVGASIGPCS